MAEVLVVDVLLTNLWPFAVSGISVTVTRKSNYNFFALFLFPCPFLSLPL